MTTISRPTSRRPAVRRVFTMPVVREVPARADAAAIARARHARTVAAARAAAARLERGR